MSYRPQFPLALGLLPLLCGCVRIWTGERVEARESQASEEEMLRRADRIVVGVVEAVTPYSDDYIVKDSYDRPAIRRQVLVSVRPIVEVWNESDVPREAEGRIQFLYVEFRGLPGPWATSGPPMGIRLGPAIVPMRRENGRWRSVIDLWPPVFKIYASEAEVGLLQGEEPSLETLRKLLLTVHPGKDRWPSVADSALLLSHFFGPVETIRELRRLADQGGESRCAVCLHLASRFRGQYRCLDQLLAEGRCTPDQRQWAASILSGRERERERVLASIRAGKPHRSMERSPGEALAVLALDDDPTVRQAALRMLGESDAGERRSR
jgi:hypothetical protein